MCLPGTTRRGSERDNKNGVAAKKLSQRTHLRVDTGVTAETELLAGLRRGDTGAFDQVYELYHQRLYGFLLRMVRRRDVAEDLLQETWIRLATNAGRLKEDTVLAAWLFTVARNVCRSYQRWRILDSERITELSLSRYRSAEDGTPFEAAAAGQLGAKLEAALAALPPRYREVLLLVGVERMSPSEAADVLGMKPDAVRQRLMRARSMIAEEVRELI